MKSMQEPNKLCLTCRRGCKQPPTVIIAECKRYYPRLTKKAEIWKQPELPLQ